MTRVHLGARERLSSKVHIPVLQGGPLGLQECEGFASKRYALDELRALVDRVLFLPM
jgi:hypothetical protein